NSFPNLYKYQERYIANLLENEFSKIDFVCFDLESDGKEITEYAWETKLSKNSNQDYQEKKEGITDLVNLLNSGVLIIGQNIKEFDLPILANHDLSIITELIWDTFEVEMVLNPTRFSYGLKAKHTAIEDTKLTYRLFKNQLSRIISSLNKLPKLENWLSPKAIEIINLIKSNPNWGFMDYEYFEKQSDEFFRPNPTNQNISEKTLIELKNKIVKNNNLIIIAPEFIWNTLSNQFDINFYSDDKTLGFCLSKEKIESTFVENQLLKTILFQYVDKCESKGLKPYFQHIPIAIQLKLTTEQASSVCEYFVVDFFNIGNKPICIKPTEIENLNKFNIQDFNIVVVGNELYNLTSKIQIGQDLDFATIFDRLKNEPIWLQMSGGKSFISIDKRQCLLLGISEFPVYVKNIWLEKIKKRKFKVCCNINFESCISDLNLSSVQYIDWVDETINKTNSFIIRPDVKNSGYIAEQKRVNPESLYRKMYWVYQFKLLEGFGNAKTPKVLIVNDKLELENLSSFARKKGYFIPDTKASLQRQMELLHKSRITNRLLIITFQSLDKVISNNYLGPVDFIWDSFMLQEKIQMLAGKITALLQVNEDDLYDDFKSANNQAPKAYDIFSLIKLHKPLIDYYYKMINDNNPDSNLFLCDTRLTDFYGIERSLNLNALGVKLWHKEAEYITDNEIATEFFSYKNESIDTDFNIEEAKEILRQIFLVPEEGGKPYHWHDYQHPCLNDILPAKKDLLISLPTGAGKSLLFQGPALFRSAFTGKLTLIISPLRALMQDQVKGLNKKGFISNVEFLSSDKTPQEIKDIYRRVAGGEITLLYITPERFRSRSFENCLLNRLDADSGLEYVVFDEAHCISQWGQEFRPDYLNAGRKVAGFSDGFKMTKLLFSATISEQVFDEISILMPGIVTVENSDKNYNPVRDHIKMDFKHNIVEDDRLAEIANYLKAGHFNPKLSRAIIFVKSRKKVDECALIMSDCLKEVFGSDCNFSEKVGAFHAAMDAEDREDTYDKFKSGEIVILFATKAFGMGMDIPNIHFVTHYSPPSTFEDFLQEVGRAGRNEEQRNMAGFSNINNPIKTLCLTANNDFAKLKDQLHESRIAWHEIKDIKVTVEKYIAKFKPLTPDDEIPVAIPFDIYSKEKGTINDEDDNKFRIALHWLERLERIKLGYYTITHLEFESASLINLANQINKCPDKNSEKVVKSILKLIPSNLSTSKVIQISVASLRSITKLNLDNLFEALIKLHSIGLLKLLQEVVIEPTNLRTDELNHYSRLRNTNNKYPALKTIFSFAKEIMMQIPNIESKLFEGEELDILLNDALSNYTNFTNLPWTINANTKSPLKTTEKYNQDIIKKRSKHAFTIIRLLGKTNHETKMEKVIDGNKKITVKQSVFNGYHKEKEWLYKIEQLEEDCIKLLDYVSKKYFDKNIKNFNWADIVDELDIKGNIQYLSNLLFIVSVLGYSRTGGLLPTGIEVYLKSIDIVDETDLKSSDKKVFDEFEDTRKVRELKLIALEVLAGFHKSERNLSLDQIRNKQGALIKKYFACNSIESLLQLLQDELPPNDPLFVKWRGDAIKTEEDKLNEEQRKVYDAEINQHINVMAGPGSGKTHTLTLRVARLVHH
ncbi:MAG: ATP-dependent helicase, RecQ family protein, partial [Bacteroidota bacterium]